MKFDDHFSGLDLFQGLSPAARRMLAERCGVRRLVAGEMLWTAGTESRGLFIVLEGMVRVVRAPGGRQYVLHTEGPGGTLGEVPLFTGGRYPATAIAVEATRCIVIDRKLLAQLFRLDPEFAFRLLGRLAERVRILVGRLDRTAGQSVGARLAAHLLGCHQAGEGGAISLGGTQAEVAEELGTVREVLVRAIRHLREAGLIESAGRGRYRVVDEPGLRRRAAGP